MFESGAGTPADARLEACTISRSTFPVSEAHMTKQTAIIATVALLVAADARAQVTPPQPQQPQQPMGFFITSVGVGDGANLGGLAGADRHCQTLAAAANAGNRTWRAYLSATSAMGQPPVHA